MNAENWREAFINQGFSGYGYTRFERRNNSWLSSIKNWYAGSSCDDHKNCAECLEKMNGAQIERLMVLGESQAEATHEIKNPLTALLLQAQILQRNGCDGQGKEFAKRVEKSLKRIQEIVDGMQTLARNSEADPFEPVSAKKIIDDAIEICRWTLSNKNIQLLVNPAASDTTIKCRPAQICQVLINLVHNARDAVEHLSHPWIRIGTEENANSAHITVTDAGNGISPDIQNHLMQPYFTTKPKGKGTGLGLSISRQIMEKHGGSLFLDTKEANTCFRLQFPKFVSFPAC